MLFTGVTVGFTLPFTLGNGCGVPKSRLSGSGLGIGVGFGTGLGFIPPKDVAPRGVPVKLFWLF